MLLLCGMKELAMLHDLVSNATPMFNVAHPLSLGTEVAWHLNLNLRTILGNSMFGSRKERVKWFITAAITQTNTSLTFKLFYADISKFRHEISPRSSLQSSLGVNNTVQKQKSSLQLNSHLISPVSLPHHRKVFCLQRNRPNVTCIMIFNNKVSRNSKTCVNIEISFVKPAVQLCKVNNTTHKFLVIRNPGIIWLVTTREEILKNKITFNIPVVGNYKYITAQF